MEFGYFDDKTREYVITNPKTPAPWRNFFGSEKYRVEITNNAGGKTLCDGGCPVSDRYIYLRDDDDRDFWSASWQPVGKDLKDYHSICRHGLGYTKFYASYTGIHSEVVYYVPAGCDYEVWAVNVENHSKRPRNLTVTGFLSFPVENQDLICTSRTFYENNKIRSQLYSNLSDDADRYDGKRLIERFLGLSGCEVSSYCGDRDSFFGEYRGLSDPEGIENGDLGNECSYASESVGAISFEITLEPGESATVCFTAGLKSDSESTEIIRHYEVHTKETVTRELKDIRRSWNEKLSALDVHSPSAEFNRMVNVCNIYEIFTLDGTGDFSQMIPEITELKDGAWYSKELEGQIEGYSDDRGRKYLKSVLENRNTAFGICTLDTPYDAKSGADEAYLNAGTLGNGGILSEDQARYILAAALLGDGDDAFMIFDESSPVSQNRKADIRRTEPYVYSNNTDGKYSPFFGRSHGDWDVKAARAVETACIEGICGIRPGKDCLYISPSIPAEWTELDIRLYYKNHDLFIRVDNHSHNSSGVSRMTLNGTDVEGCCISDADMTENCDIRVYL
ncbi:MAG: GH36-type glycosyl hydrolase domain-containing protein [Candidatus Weimeria sp.]